MRSRCVAIFVAVFVMGVLTVQSASAQTASTPLLATWRAPAQATAGDSVEISWTIRNGTGADTYLRWDTKSRNAGSQRFRTTAVRLSGSTQTTKVTLAIPADATKIFITPVYLMNSRESIWPERTIAISKGIALAKNVTEAQDAVVLLIAENAFGEITSGTGFVVSTDVILTNEHVVAEATSLRAIFPDGMTSAGTVIGIDAKHDLAAIRATTPSNVKRLDWETGTREPVTSDVWAWGYPGGTLGFFGLSAQPTVTRGVVSQYQTGRSGVTYLQTNADINPGNSGGPLITSTGRVVGVNTFAITDASSGAVLQGLNFAVSIVDHRSTIRAILRGQGPAGSDPPSAARALNARLIPLVRDGIEEWCDPASAFDASTSIVGLCLSADYPSTLRGATADVEWSRDGASVCQYSARIDDAIQSARSLFSCSPASMLSGTYTVTLRVGGQVTAQTSAYVRGATPLTAATVESYLSALSSSWLAASGVIDAYASQWNLHVNAIPYSPELLSVIAGVQAQEARGVVAWLDAQVQHPALTDQSMRALHDAARSRWVASASYYQSLVDVAQGRALWALAEGTWAIVVSEQNRFHSLFCDQISRWGLGNC